MSDSFMKKTDLILIGCSAGGVEALTRILSDLPTTFRFPIVIILHMGRDSKDLFSRSLGHVCKLPVSEAEEKQPIQAPHIYIAPADYHLLFERNHTFSLSTEEPVCFSRPSIDVSFISAACAYRDRILGIILTGANQDGANGLKTLIEYGGYGIVQDPTTAEFPEMPQAALAKAKPQSVMKIEEIAELLWNA
jgi:two-component system chemotaxis response regulator CheB